MIISDHLSKTMQCVTLVAIVVVGVAIIFALDRFVWRKSRGGDHRREPKTPRR